MALSQAANTHEPVPVSLAGAKRPSQSSASPTSGQSRRTTGSQSLRPPRLKKGAYCDEGGISCQFRVLEHLMSAHGAARVNDQIPPLGQLDGGQPLADPLPPGRETSNENRYIRSQRPRKGGKVRRGETAVPELIQGKERGRRIGASPAEAPSLRDALQHPQVRPERRAARSLERACRPHREIGFGGHVRRALAPRDRAVLAHADRDRVGEIDELKERLQLVVAVGAAARDVQKEIQLRRRGPAALVRSRRALHDCQSSTRSFTFTSARSSVRRAGNHSLPTAT